MAIIQYQNFETVTPSSSQTTVLHSLPEVEPTPTATAERIDKATRVSTSS